MSCLVTLIFLAERRLGLSRETYSIYKTLSSYVISQLCRVCVCVCKILHTIPVFLFPHQLVMGEGFQRDQCQKVPNAASSVSSILSMSFKTLY